MKPAEATLEEAPRRVNVGNGYLNQGEPEAGERIYACVIEWAPANKAERETSDYGGVRLS